METPNIVKRANELGLDNTELKFFSSIKEAIKYLGKADIVFTSGTLQYCPNPLEYLQDLINLKADFFYITRTIFSENKDIIKIQKALLRDNGAQNVPIPDDFQDKLNKEIYYPNVFVNRRSVEKIINQEYDIRFCIEEEKSVVVMPKHNLAFNMYGYFCDLKK